MDNFDMAVALIKEAQEEKRRYEARHKAYMAVLDSPEPRDWQTFYHEHPELLKFFSLPCYNFI